MATIDLASNSALLSVAEKLAEQNQLLSSIAVRGKSAFIRYSAHNDGTDFTETWSAGQNYIGHAVDFEAPTDKSAYTWSLFASNMRETLNVTLAADAWVNGSQTIETLSIGENSTVFPTPTPESKEEYLSAGVMISAATANSLVFTCLNTPAADISVTVFVTEPTVAVGGGTSDSGLGQSDWEAGAGEPGEILNKPFGDIMLYAFNSRDEFLNGQDVATQLVDGETYTVVFDGVSYTCTAKAYEDVIRLGNNDIYEGVETTNPEPFVIEQSDTMISGYLAADDTADHTVQIIFTKTIDPKYSGASWDALVGKPFYEGTVDLGETITWDGTLDDSAIKTDLGVELPGGMVYDIYIKHVSDTIPTVEDLGAYSATMYVNSSGEEHTQIFNYENNPLTEYDGCFAGEDGVGFFIATKENALFSRDGLEITLPKPGIYFMYMNIVEGQYKMRGYTQEFTIPGYNFQMYGVQKLDPKFVHTPDWNAEPGEPGEILNRPFGEVVTSLGDTLVWDGTHDNNTVKHFDSVVGEALQGIIHTHYMSAEVPTIDELYTGTVTVFDEYEGDVYTETISLDTAYIENYDDVVYLYGNNSYSNGIPLVVATMDNVTAYWYDVTITLPKKGIYALEICTTGYENTRLSVSELCIPGHNFEIHSINKLDPKFIHTPDWNAGNGTGGEILNRPFYDYTQEFGDTVTWDGIEKSEDDIVLELGGFKEHMHYLASNVPTIEELETGTVVYVDNGENYTVSITNDIHTSSNGIIDFGNGLFQVIPEDNFGGTPLKKGIWCLCTRSSSSNIDYGKSLTIPGYNFYLDQFKKIDPKFIDTPDWDALEHQAGYIKNRPFGTTIGTGDTLHKDIGYSESVEVEGGLLKLYHMCDNVPTAEELVGSTVTMRAEGESVVVELTEEMISVSENGVISVQADSLPVLLIAPDDISEPMDGLLLTLKKGVHFVDVLMGMAVTESLQIPGYEFPAISIQKIDMQYLPFGSQGVTVEWDGVLEGKETIEYTTNDKDYVLVKLTDRAFTEEELASAIVTYADQTTGSLTELESMLETAYNTVLDSNGNYGFHRLQLLSSPSKLTNAGYYGFFELEATGTYVTYNADLSLPEIIKLEVPNAYQTIDEKYLPNNYVTRAMFDDEVAQRRALENVIGYNGTWTGLTLVDALSEAFATKDELQEAQMATQDMLNAFESHLGFVTTGLEEQTVAEVINDTFATKEELIAATEPKVTATVGQTIVVKAVDENGKPTEWEAVDMPTFELVSPNGTRYNLAVADDGTLSAVAIVEEPTDPVEPEPEEPVDPEVDPTEPTGDATEE